MPDEEIAAVLESDLPAAIKLRTVDRLRGRSTPTRRADSPEERRRRLYLIRGGAGAIIGAVVAWAWDAARRPSTALAAGGSGAAGIGILLVPGMMTPPPVPPDRPTPTPPAIIVSMAPEQRWADAAVVVESDAELQHSTRPKSTIESEVQPTPAPTVPTQTYATAEPELTDKPQEAGPEPEPTVELAPSPMLPTTPAVDRKQLCREVGLPPSASLDACLSKADRLGVDVDLDLGLLSR